MKIFLGLAAFLIVVNQQITERDCKWIFIMTGVGAAFDFAKMVFYYRVLGFSIGGFENSLNFYTWQQELSGVPLILVLIFFSRYRASEIFSWKNPWGPMLLLVCVPLIFLSGKRSAVICLFLYPAIATFYRREFRYLFLSGGCALAVAVVLVAGHGTLFHLPLTTQRALSWLPGKWDSELTNMEGGTDAFRAKLRTFARTRISQHPWIGRGYDVQAESSARLSLTMENKFDAYVEQQALGSSWHNRWLGYAADFGIPASMLLAIIYLSIIVLCWRTIPRLPSGSLLQTMVMYTLIMTVIDVLFSNVSGHSALDAFTRWWMYGVVVSIASSLKPEKVPGQLDSPQFRRVAIEPDAQPVRL